MAQNAVPPPEYHSENEAEDLWGQALRKALRSLPAKDSEWLADERNQQPFTSTQITERILAHIDPIVSHIRSFTSALSAVSHLNIVGVGLIWGSMHLLLVVAGRTQRSLELILDLLSDLSPRLALFSRWHMLFPDRPFSEVGDAIKDAYYEILAFCSTAVRHLRRNPMSTEYLPDLNIYLTCMQHKLHKHKATVIRCTERIWLEVETSHIQFVHSKLAAIGSVVDAAPTPRYLELPTIRIIPHSRNSRFFGRQGIISQMREKLLPSQSLSGEDGTLRVFPEARKQQRFALSGLGGSGKTQIALEYTYRHLEDYKVVIWILADSPEKIDHGFEEAAGVLGMPKGSQSAGQVRTFVLQRLSATNEPYLLCFNNADDLSLVKHCFPRDNTGTILVTSRDSVGIGEVIGDGVIVPEFTIQEGCSFLGTLLPDVDMSNPRTMATLEDISTTFHGYPLALAQAAAFIRNGGCSLSSFLGIFRDKRHSNAIASIPVEDYHATLFTVWDLSFQALSEPSRQILEILVYFDPDSVPFVLLREGCLPRNAEHDDTATASIASDLRYMADPVDLWAALKGLRAQSLIRTNRELETISIHRFLQEQAFRRLCFEPSRRRKAFAESLFLLLNHQPEFPNVTQHWSPDLFRDSERCLAHIQRLAARLRRSASETKAVLARVVVGHGLRTTIQSPALVVHCSCTGDDANTPRYTPGVHGPHASSTCLHSISTRAGARSPAPPPPSPSPSPSRFRHAHARELQAGVDFHAQLQALAREPGADADWVAGNEARRGQRTQASV
ncbi:P-loop containing nucleoside triphosphate hydrolase protein [Podospora appendiculata]|uniref:P-loop containing nucleoside triphosphate hydrolase protein n=1 Tax=Podospora appendiculata TaxID=314037 RepID=A0AAE0X2I7_9PEZI|nr:P-loop containing nucleoside triphosphate hydrolase protein [Podospora appendiculata]